MPIIVGILIMALSSAVTRSGTDFQIFDRQGKQRDMDAVIADISAARAVFIGENHDRYDHHLEQLEIIRRLYERDPNRWALGVEFIQWPFQADLDAYIRGEIDEREFLKRTEYFDRWGYDFRLYRPIFRFAREHGIPVIALNAPRELTERVGKGGLEGLTEAERKQVPGVIDKGDRAYRKRIQDVFKQHGKSPGANFEYFWEAQLVWDETMAERTAEYLSAHADKSVVVLAGSGHVEFGSGIPNRVRRRLPELKTTSLIMADKPQKKRDWADHSLVSKKQVLPPAAKLGITMETAGPVRVKNVTKSAAASGIQTKDRIMTIDGAEVKSPGDVRLALLDKKAGDSVQVHVQREMQDGIRDFAFPMTLQE